MNDLNAWFCALPAAALPAVEEGLLVLTLLSVKTYAGCQGEPSFKNAVAFEQERRSGRQEIL